ncbi:MAG: SPOR domain-containing protein [Deltaproteobacteria bacterium]|nr:SPOR domain-containing protein [Deltaproteobacteria bacterium]
MTGPKVWLHPVRITIVALLALAGLAAGWFGERMLRPLDNRPAEGTRKNETRVMQTTPSPQTRVIPENKQASVVQAAAGTSASGAQQTDTGQTVVDNATQKAPEAPAARESARSEPEPAPGFSVQVGAHIDVGFARRRAEELRKSNYHPCIRSLHDPQGKQRFVIQIGNFKDEQEAWKAADAFSQQQQAKAFVVTRPTQACLD